MTRIGPPARLGLATRPRLARLRAAAGAHRDDLLAVLAILGAGLLLVGLVPPAHEYPIIDDWIYAGAVRDLLSTGAFHMPDASQAILVGQTVWGAMWVALFGFSFTVLTWSTLFWSAVALIAFYAIARLLGAPMKGALLGVGLLGLNPIFLHLSYSFMTDVPFLALVLLSSVCYIRGLQTGSLGWHFMGGLFAGLSFLIRQPGALAPAAFVAYLLVEQVWRRRRAWGDVMKEAVAMSLAPVAIFGLWYVWLRAPLTGAAMAATGRAEAFIFKEPWLRVILLRTFNILPLTALFAWAAVKLPRARLWLVLAWIVAIVVGVYLADRPDENWIPVDGPPFTLQAGPLSYVLPNEVFTFGTRGNIVRVTGIDFFEYTQESIWTPEVWRGVWLLGVLLGAVLLAGMTSRLGDRLRSLRRGPPAGPVAAFYALGAAIFVASVAFPGDLFDRYALGFTPFVILFVVLGASTWGRLAWVYSITALVLLGAFTVTAKLDQIDHDNARWQAGYWMKSRVDRVHVGFDWDYWMGGFSETYQVADVPLPGFRVEQPFPYTCRLCGFTTRTVLAQSRMDVPPLAK